MTSKYITAIAFFLVTSGPPAISATEQEGSKYAIIIGVNKYLDKAGISTLKYAVSDATAIYETLIDPNIGGFPAENAVLMVDDADNLRRIPTRSNILATLKTWLSLPSRESDTVIISFSGHGIESEGQSYIMPIDAMMSVPEETAIELAKIKEWLKACPAKKKILVLDCCHSGAGKGLKGMGVATMSAIKQPDGMVTLASCDLQERSYEWEEKQHGTFTYFLLEGLKGAADSNNDGAVWASELNYYVWDKTRRWAADQGLQQNPVFVAAVSGYIELARKTESAALKPEAAANVAAPSAAKELATARKYIETGLYDDAANIIEAFHKKAEPTAESYTLLGMAYSKKKGWYMLAVRQYKQALDIDPIFQEALVQLAALHIKDGSHAHEAIPLLKKALILSPDDQKIKDMYDSLN